MAEIHYAPTIGLSQFRHQPCDFERRYMIPEPVPVAVTPKPPCLTPDLCRTGGGPCMVGSGCSDDPRGSS